MKRSPARRSARAIGFALALLATAAASAAPPAARSGVPCDSKQARAFDFWIGEWSIEQRVRASDGSWISLPARTSVSPALGGCALVERWEGEVQFHWEGMEEPELMQGLSVRAYDAGSDTWRIHWMDTRSPLFGSPFTGGFHDGRGEFKRIVDTPAGEGTARIVFSDIGDDSAHWELAVSNDDGRSWSTLWSMEMRRTRAAGGGADAGTASALPGAAGCTAAGDDEAVAAIVALVEEVEAANNAGDVERWVGSFAEDAIYMPPGAPAVTTREGLLEVAEAGFRHQAAIDIEPLEIRVCEDWAFARSRATGTVTLATSREVVPIDVDQLVIYVRRPGGAWRIARMIMNSNLE